MKNNILDEIEKEIEPPKFALKSYDQFWYSIIIYSGIFIVIFLLDKNQVNIRYEIPFFGSALLGMIAFVINFFGMLNYLKSRKRKEYFTWKLLIGGIGNLLLFLSWMYFLFLYQMFNRSAFHF